MIAQAKNDENQPDNAGSTDIEQSSAKAGGQPLNRNGWRHGLYSSKSPFAYVDRMVGKFRRALEDAVVEASKGIDVRQASLIHTATEATRQALSNRKRLEDAEAVTDEVWLAYSRAYLAALDLRDRKVKELGLKSNRFDPYAALYKTPIPAT